MGAHLPLEQVMQLAGRLAVVRAEILSEPHRVLHPNDATKCVDAIGAVMRDCNSSVAACAVGHKEDVLERMMAELRAEADKSLRQCNCPGVAAWHNIFVAETSERTCHCCNSSRVCAGGDEWREDARTISTYGLCVRPLRELFQDALSVTSGIYNRASSHIALHVDLNTAHFDSPGAHGPFACAGKIRRTQTGVNSVTLLIDLPRFDKDAYLTTLYVLFHELFCHGRCGIPIGTDSAAVSLSFAEGWMDWVGVQALTHFPHHSLPQDSIVSRGFTEVRRLAADYHSYRTNPSANARDGAVNRYGALSAEKLYFLMQGVLRVSPETAFWHVADFSTAINASSHSDAERNALVDAVFARLWNAKNSTDAAVSAPQAWADAIENFAQGGDAERLFHALRDD